MASVGSLVGMEAPARRIVTTAHMNHPNDAATTTGPSGTVASLGRNWRGVSHRTTKPSSRARSTQQPIKPRACIVGEPTDMKVIVGHKGKLSCTGRVRGLECHSSLAPKGVNAIQAAAKAIAKLADMAARKAEEVAWDWPLRPSGAPARLFDKI